MNPRLSMLTEILDALPLGVVVLDRNGTVVHFNRAEEQLARRERGRALGRNFFTEVAPCMDVQELGGMFRDRIGRGTLFERVEISFAFPFLESARDVTVFLRSLDLDGEPYAALIIEDVSDRRAAQRMQLTLSELLRPDAGSPIAGILASCGYLLDQVPEMEGPALDTVGDIAYSADELQTMLMNLLDISRLEGHRLEVVVARHDLPGLVEAAVAPLRGHAARRGVHIEVQTPPTLEAMLDPALMLRMLDSLLLNALRNAPAHSTVRVIASTGEHGRPCVDVHDQGMPLADALLPSTEHRYFPELRPVESDPSFRDPNALAMTFVQLGCVAHGGALTVHSSADRGTTYRVELPVPKPATAFLGSP
ncbi:MAG: PAS domain-containing protein [Myxococcales bacterium]|nr:PAS domain-containing protein [Myxococcales bacterium]